MKKIFSLTGFAVGMLICSSVVAQTINKAEYFFDSDPGVGNGSAIAIPVAADSVDITGSINTTGLSAGFHRLFIRARYGSNKRWSLYEGRNFYIYPPTTAVNVKIKKAEYFFDTDPGVNNGTTIVTGTAADSIDITSSVSTNGLAPGFHKLFVRVKNQSNVWSLYEPRNFYIIPPQVITQVQIVAAEYFIDNDPGQGNAIAIPTGVAADSINITSTVNTTGLPPGFHRLLVRVKNQSNVWSLYESRNFYIIPPPVATQVKIVAAEYFFDTEPGIGNGTAISTGAAADSVDISSTISIVGLPKGFHKLLIRVKNQSNVWSLYEARNFFIGDTTQANAAQIVSAEYFFDTDPGTGNGTAVAPAFAAADSVDITSNASAAGLSLGTHIMYVRVLDLAGKWSTSLGDTLFIGPNGINDLAGNANISLSPNPNDGNFIMSYHLPEANNIIQVKDVTGRIVFEKEIADVNGNQKINLSFLSGGIYNWGITSDKKPYAAGKVVIVN